MSTSYETERGCRNSPASAMLRSPAPGADETTRVQTVKHRYSGSLAYNTHVLARQQRDPNRVDGRQRNVAGLLLAFCFTFRLGRWLPMASCCEQILGNQNSADALEKPRDELRPIIRKQSNGRSVDENPVLYEGHRNRNCRDRLHRNNPYKLRESGRYYKDKAVATRCSD